jgi:hypothetical protein
MINNLSIFLFYDEKVDYGDIGDISTFK